MTEVTVDMKSSYINSVKEELPKAKIVLDYFHIIQDANREISKAIEIEASVSRSRLPRRVFFKNAEKLKDKEKEKLRKILREHPYISPYYVIKEMIRKAYKAKDKERAREILELAIAYGRKTGDTDIKKWTDRLVKYEEYILNYFDSRATNAQLEGSNLVVKLIKRISFGFRNLQNYIQRLSIAFLTLPGHIPIIIAIWEKRETVWRTPGVKRICGKRPLSLRRSSISS